ncbi:hypothetical protein SAMN05660479_02836 [Microbulbifer thermotolerans]|nr:hypothetical protein SAMN05660479_02836 [Microbulbifer thermotolerans]
MRKASDNIQVLCLELLLFSRLLRSAAKVPNSESRVIASPSASAQMLRASPGTSDRYEVATRFHLTEGKRGSGDLIGFRARVLKGDLCWCRKSGAGRFLGAESLCPYFLLGIVLAVRSCAQVEGSEVSVPSPERYFRV